MMIPHLCSLPLNIKRIMHTHMYARKKGSAHKPWAPPLALLSLPVSPTLWRLSPLLLPYTTFGIWGGQNWTFDLQSYHFGWGISTYTYPNSRQNYNKSLIYANFLQEKIFFFKKSKIFAQRDRCFFDLSDHEIVGGCSTLLAKSNKKMHFSRPRSFVYQNKPVCIPDRAITNTKSQWHLPLAFLRMLEMVGVDVHPLLILERESRNWYLVIMVDFLMGYGT